MKVNFHDPNKVHKDIFFPFEVVKETERCISRQG